MRGDSTPPRVDEFRYDVAARWEQLPAGITHQDVSAVDVDSADRVYLLTRFDSNVLVYEPDGRSLPPGAATRSPTRTG